MILQVVNLCVTIAYLNQKFPVFLKTDLSASSAATFKMIKMSDFSLIKRLEKNSRQLPQEQLLKWKHLNFVENFHLTLVLLNFFRKYENMFAFLSFLNTEIAQIIEILQLWRQGAVSSVSSIPWLLMTWWHKEPRHQQPWYWPICLGIFPF